MPDICLSEESSTKQIFEEKVSLLTVKFCILRFQLNYKGKKKYLLQYFTDAINYRNLKKVRENQ